MLIAKHAENSLFSHSWQRLKLLKENISFVAFEDQDIFSLLKIIKGIFEKTSSLRLKLHFMASKDKIINFLA